MIHTSDDDLRRAFARAPVVGPDENFVATLAQDVARRRTRRRMLLGSAGVTAAALLAVVLASLAPTAGLSSTGMTLLQLPERIGALAPQPAPHLPSGAWFYLMLALCALPLGATAWILRGLPWR